MTTTLLFEKDIDLNALFTLNYNFDMLKTILQELLKNNKTLTEKLDSQDKKIKENEEKFNTEVYNIKNKFNSDISIINNRLDNHDKDIKDLYDKLKDYDNLKDDLSKLTLRVDKNENNINNNRDDIDKSKTIFHNIYLLNISI